MRAFYTSARVLSRSLGRKRELRRELHFVKLKMFAQARRENLAFCDDRNRQ